MHSCEVIAGVRKYPAMSYSIVIVLTVCSIVQSSHYFLAHGCKVTVCDRPRHVNNLYVKTLHREYCFYAWLVHCSHVRGNSAVSGDCNFRDVIW